jgi:hypothetical protein
MRAGVGRGRPALAAILAACLAITTSACGSAPTPTGSPAPGTTTSAGTQAPSSPGIAETPAASQLLPSNATYAEASAREAADVQAMRDEVGFTSAVGADAPAALAFMAAADREFSAQLFVEAAAKFGLAPVAGAAMGIVLARFVGGGDGASMSRAEDLRAPDLQSQATGYVAFGGLLIAKSDEPLSGSLDNTATKKGTAGSSDVEQTNKAHMEVNLGQGLTDLLVNLESSTKTTKDGAVTAILNGTASTKVKINSCPDTSGHVTGNVEMKVSELNSAGGATSTTDLTIAASFTLSVDAGAHLTGIQIDATTSGGGIGGGSSWTAGGTTSFGGGSAPTSTSNGATPEQAKRVTDGAFYAFWAVSAIAVEAEKFWRSGKCVDMNSSVESKNVAPKEKVTFTVEPRGAFDKQPIDAGLDVMFDGKESLDPSSGNHKPPVSFTYTAGEKKDEKGTISLKQTSNRGIGTKTITFTVGEQDYKINYAGGYVYNGTKCKGLAGPWTVQITVGGGNGTVTFTIPEDLGTAVATTDYKLNVAGTKNTFHLVGTVKASTDADGKAFLILALGSGTITQVNPNGSGTFPMTDPTVDNIPLETGSFCGT